MFNPNSSPTQNIPEKKEIDIDPEEVLKRLREGGTITVAEAFSALQEGGGNPTAILMGLDNISDLSKTNVDEFVQKILHTGNPKTIFEKWKKLQEIGMDVEIVKNYFINAREVVTLSDYQKEFLNL